MVLPELTAEQKQAIYAQMKADDAAKEVELKSNRKAYKEMVNQTVPELFDRLLESSSTLSEVKTLVYNELKALITLKSELYGSEDNQSHTFTTTDGISIMVGHRMSDGWDDTVTAGIQKVDNYLSAIGGDKKTTMLVSTIRKLLSKDAKGNLKSQRVLQLKKIAEEHGELELIEAINIIQDAYRPVRSVEFVTCRYKGNNGDIVDLPLDMSSAPFDFKMPLQYANKKTAQSSENSSQENTA
jgi:hypothetical protein